MALPPFPSQEVAKLVLGYLAEEHLMTAYDEFLQASPYLDAFRNEYGRVFMTSLKNILAEYMAVKIYVESCKPISLRKKLMQCTNLLEVVKLLVALVDIQKANFQDTEKPRIYKPNAISKGNGCDDCSLNYANCSCHSFVKKQVSCETEDITQCSVEATSLADLPGNSVIQEDNRKNVSSAMYNIQRCQLNSSEDNLIQGVESEPSNHVESNINSVTSSTAENSNDNIRSTSQPALSMSKSNASGKNTEEFNTIFDVEAEQNAICNVPSSKTILNTGSFQEFADGVGGTMKDKDFSSHTPNNLSGALIYQNNAHCIINMDSSTRQTISAPLSGYTYNNELHSKPSSLNEKNPEQKIKIISDIKVNNTYSKMPPILKSTTTCSPLVQMQTLYINGTPAYKNKLQTGSNYSYTKDEIMAMPTIIIVPASGTSKNPHIVVPHTTTATEKQNVDTITSNSTISSRVLTPLTIDVPPPSSVSEKTIKDKDVNLKDIENTNEKGLVKTVDMTTASLPKEASGTSLSKTSTPTVLPPMKKSSSTPRRTSHIRVLDFTTPRRILNENSNDKNVNDSNIPSKALLDHVEERKERSNGENALVNFIIPHKSSQIDKPLEKTVKPKKKSNWDADLRALLTPNDPDDTEITKKIPEQHKKVSKKRLKNKDTPKVKSINKSKPTNCIKQGKEKTSPSKKTKKKIKPDKKTDDSILAAVKPTINIITTKSETPPQENNNKQCQIDNVTEQSDTPEAERLALQNVIGAKLNISDLLETPYKQAIYDIQMETPRFLGPDLPDEPMSDIKIMNIPTPRFFDTPKITQATPSSYSSRQTDYSSGGSYYKPDDQDYIPIAEVLECAIRVERMDKENSRGEVHERSRRPVRKCTKNVSYRKSSNQHNRIQEEIKPNRNSKSNDVNSPFVLDKKTNKKNSRATPNRKNKPKESSSECEPSRKDTKASPLKIETQKHFMKVKPRKIPIKESSAKRIRKLSDSSKQLFYHETQPKKRTIKDTKAACAITATSAAAPTKSRRKSATPRKLHCTKSFNSDSGEHNLCKSKEDVLKNLKVLCPQDSDTEQPPLRWSDDGSQEDKSKDVRVISHPQNEEDDIDNIKKYIENCSKSDGDKNSQNNKDSNFDLKRSFDAETAKIIERDLLDTPPRLTQPAVMEIAGIENKQLTEINASTNSESANTDKDENDDNEEEEEEVELSVCDCNEDSKNYFSYIYDETKFKENNDLAKLKDKFCMELCMEDGISIRLNATTISTVFEQDPGDFAVDESYFNETVTAVSSISNIEKLYTPIKDVRNQCIEIFDSTLTSLDTPLKVNSPKEKQQDAPLTEIVLEIENIQYKENTDIKRRKRYQSCVVEESVQSTKKLKSETQELLKSANIQNMDIESVLSKLHGP